MDSLFPNFRRPPGPVYLGALRSASRFRGPRQIRRARRKVSCSACSGCKITSGPALDLLWSKLTSPARLIDLIPEDALIKGTHGAAQWALRRPLVESDFLVFDKYASRVRCVDFASSLTSMAGGCELFATLKSFRDPILPRLEDFEWH
ncbi:hypothetical protein C8R44DRAFT_778788, partial [Mycena epipterygia]